ncbi:MULTISPECIES: electron transport complex subunit RsxA [Congzhengia]|jgi:electron transport complex protein RnfA|uniref:Ion-translocating oxidoreductase complex subunit A n=1 Tax=Congzhengia minquanensis TaxID=2763657 RepID=A0A926DMI0_9FIRM|nr:electron transport complex subunit RsxA [Congzhengia minquanensis]MBC8541720.1 electron transport complex subunit RsxA [Congzhengia minquanensis]MBD8947960.1 electron transport complex subunit RsxA [Clostridiales bacterium]
MELLTKLVLLSLTTILANNYVLVKFLGICPFLGVSKKVGTAVGMSVAVTFVMTVASAATYFIQKLLVHFQIEYMQTVAFILVIAVLVQVVEMAIQRFSPALYSALGIYLPLITTNCAVLGVALLNVQEGYDFVYTLVYSFSAGLSFMLAIVLFAGVRERLETADIPKPLQGFPIALVTAGLIAMAFLGFSGMSF